MSEQQRRKRRGRGEKKSLSLGQALFPFFEGGRGPTSRSRGQGRCETLENQVISGSTFIYSLCECVCLPVTVCREIRATLAIFLNHFHLSFWNWVPYWMWSTASLACQWAPGRPLSPQLGLQAHIITPVLSGCWGSKLSSSCLHSMHFSSELSFQH